MKQFFYLILIFTFSINTQAQTVFKDRSAVKGLAVGDTVKNFVAIGLAKDSFRLKEALKEGPIVLLFYRGQWCPVCNKHLSELQDSLPLILAKGAQVIAISPEKPEYLLQTESKTKASFLLLYDENYAIAKSFDVLFRPTKVGRDLIDIGTSANLKNAQSDDSEQLPIPATFIINQQRIIVWRQFDENYKNRASVAEILQYIPIRN